MNMIEKMAREMASNRGFDPDKMIRKPVHDGPEFTYEDVPVWWSYRKDAKAALSALKQPTDGMIGPVSGNVVVGCCIAGKQEIEEIWDWMITLAEEGK